MSNQTPAVTLFDAEDRFRAIPGVDCILVYFKQADGSFGPANRCKGETAARVMVTYWLAADAMDRGFKRCCHMPEIADVPPLPKQMVRYWADNQWRDGVLDKVWTAVRIWHNGVSVEGPVDRLPLKPISDDYWVANRRCLVRNRHFGIKPVVGRVAEQPVGRSVRVMVGRDLYELSLDEVYLNPEDLCT